MNIKKFLGLQSKEDKIQEYRQLLEKSYRNSLKSRWACCRIFRAKIAFWKSISILSDDDRKGSWGT